MKSFEEDMKAPYWRAKTVAKALGVSIPTLYRYIETGVVPKPIRLTEHCVVWNKDTILNAINQKEVL